MEGGSGLEPRLDPSCVSSLNLLANDSIPESAVLAVDSGLEITFSNTESLKNKFLFFIRKIMKPYLKT